MLYDVAKPQRILQLCYKKCVCQILAQKKLLIEIVVWNSIAFEDDDFKCKIKIKHKRSLDFFSATKVLSANGVLDSFCDGAQNKSGKVAV